MECEKFLVSDLISSIPWVMPVTVLNSISIADWVGGGSPAGDPAASCGTCVRGSMVPNGCFATGLRA